MAIKTKRLKKADILEVLGKRPPFTPKCELCGEPVETQTSIDMYGTRQRLVYCTACGRKEQQVWAGGGSGLVRKTLIDGVIVSKKPKDTRSLWEQRVALVIGEV